MRLPPAGYDWLQLVTMRHQTRFAAGLLISAALHAAVLGKYWSADWFVQTPETKTTVFRVRVLQPHTPAPLKTVSALEAVAKKPKQKPAPAKPRKRKKPQPQARKKAARPKPAMKPGEKAASASPRKAAKQVKAEPVKPAQAAAAQPLASAGRIATIEDRYRTLVRKEIEKRKFYPARARRQRRQGTVTVGFELARDGRIRNLRLVKKCKSAILGRAALEAVRKVGLFPSFPAEIHRLSWSFEIPLSYRIK